MEPYDITYGFQYYRTSSSYTYFIFLSMPVTGFLRKYQKNKNLHKYMYILPGKNQEAAYRKQKFARMG